MTVSVLDNIPGIGIKRRTDLLKAFKSAKNIAIAEVADIAKVKGMTKALAEVVKAELNK
jgi:excinuclease ABC subunit C